MAVNAYKMKQMPATNSQLGLPVGSSYGDWFSSPLAKSQHFF